MPWTRAKKISRALRNCGDFPEGYTGSRTVAELTELFDACFGIQREAIEAAGHHIPLVVENVKGAQPWVGRSRWHYGSFHLWGDVPALMPMTRKLSKVPGFRFDGSGRSFQTASVEGVKVGGLDWSKHGEPGYAETYGKCFRDSAIKNGGRLFPNDAADRRGTKRKAASALIAKIPLDLARWIGQAWITPPAARRAPQ